MKLKNLKLLGVILAFLFCFPLHFLYDKVPSFITSIISPVNESIWEHMKILFGSIILLVFGCLNIITYLTLLMVLYCTVNHSCICFLCCSSEKQRFDRDIFFDKLPLYIQKILKFYNFFGIFDYHILLSNIEMYSSQSNENLNNNAVTIDDQKDVKL